MSDFTVVSFYTDKYKDVVVNLKESLERFKIPYVIKRLNDTGDWVKNCAMKPGFILDIFKEANTSIVWLDADAVVQSYPTLFLKLETDLACHFRNDKRYYNELLSGTLFFKRSLGAERILEKWTKQTAEEEGAWDQRTLQKTVETMEGISIYRLPATYTQIYDTMADRGDPVISHFQHSRAIKKGLL